MTPSFTTFSLNSLDSTEQHEDAWRANDAVPKSKPDSCLTWRKGLNAFANLRSKLRLKLSCRFIVSRPFPLNKFEYYVLNEVVDEFFGLKLLDLDVRRMGSRVAASELIVQNFADIICDDGR